MTSYNNATGKNEGIIKNKKTYFAILAHKNEEALAAQIQNIRHFNPDAGIIIYNGGTDPDFGKRLNTLHHPNSHPIRYGNLTPYFWEVMKWLEENHIEYNYLINLDHDVLFVKDGFLEYVDKLMKDYDVMGWDMVTSHSPSDAVITCCREMWAEWDTWGPLFGTNSFIRYLNSTQVYRHDIVRRMLETTDQGLVEDMIANSKVFALEEIFFVTLAASKGARIREYPRDENWKRSSRFRGQITLEEAEWVKEHPYYYWIHPVKEERLIQLNNWLFGKETPLTEENNSGQHQPENLEGKKNETGHKVETIIPLPVRSSRTLLKAGKRKKTYANKKPAGNLNSKKKRMLNKQPIKTLRKRKPLKARTTGTINKHKASFFLPSSLRGKSKTKLRTPTKLKKRLGRQRKRSA